MTSKVRETEIETQSQTWFQSPLLSTALPSIAMHFLMISHSLLQELEHPEGHKCQLCSLLQPTTSQSVGSFQLESVCSQVSVSVWLEERCKCTNSHQCPDATKLGSWSKDCRRPREREFGSRSRSLHCNRMIWEFTAVQRQGLLSQLCHWFTLCLG